MENPNFKLETQPSHDDIEFLEQQINAFNLEATGTAFDAPLTYFMRGPNGHILAGLHGWTWGGCCEVSLLWVHADFRGKGHGARLLRAAEEEALRRGCRQVLLDTHSFQAPGFYLQNGYEAIAVIDDYPTGHQKIYLRKYLKGD